MAAPCSTAVVLTRASVLVWVEPPACVTGAYVRTNVVVTDMVTTIDVQQTLVNVYKKYNYN